MSWGEYNLPEKEKGQPPRGSTGLPSFASTGTTSVFGTPVPKTLPCLSVEELY
jgi:hypothetical protein